MTGTDNPQLRLRTPLRGSWVQVERRALEQWALLMRQHPTAASVLATLVAQMGGHNALVISQKTLAHFTGCTDRTIRNALKILVAGNWIEVRQIGPRGTACAYVINDRVSWSGKRDGIRYSLFSAAVVVSDDEQPDRDEIGAQPLLNQIPTEYPDEKQLPIGPGLPPPSQPHLEGMEPDLPARRPANQIDLEEDVIASTEDP